MIFLARFFLFPVAGVCVSNDPPRCPCQNKRSAKAWFPSWDCCLALMRSTLRRCGVELEQIQFLWEPVSVQVSEVHFDCKQRFKEAVKDETGIEPGP